MRTFRDYSPEERRNFITLSTGEYYPDILEDACRLYSPRFGNVFTVAESL